MSKIKKFIKENKNEIILGSIIGGLIGAVYLTNRYYNKNFHLIPKELDAISWRPDRSFISLESAKKALDLNANNDEASFAIIKDGCNYIGLILGKHSKVILAEGDTILEQI
ncbi:MAG: hypothetical protein K0S61_107 [Anaerocolumna sp.]|jgi:hypothetical protein|nr:hypothetical protein [Anaerocolumna sp.]